MKPHVYCAGWDLALRMAAWPEDREVWTGSCPCQPFSSAGKRLGFVDERHLWPYWCNLIAKRRPAVVFGEQVASASDWLAVVRGDMEAMGYAVGCVPIEAASVGARHKRDRYWFVAHSEEQRLAVWDARTLSRRAEPEGAAFQSQRCNSAMAHANGEPSLGSSVSWPERDPWLVEPDVGRVAFRLPQYVEQLRALGNSIVPQCGAAFITAASAALASLKKED